MSRILIVEDNEVIILMLSAILSARDYVVTIAKNGVEGADILTGEEKFDLVLCDLMMPVSDGFDFLQLTSDYRKDHGIPVCISSALEDSKSIIKALQLGADDYIVKPVDKEILLEKISILLKKGSEDKFAYCKCRFQLFPDEEVLILGANENSLFVDAKLFKGLVGDVFEISDNYFNRVVGVGSVIVRVGEVIDVMGESLVPLSFVGLVENERKKIRGLCIKGEDVIDPYLAGDQTEEVG
jgi:CheY-like chemotaxis protein